MLCRRAVAESTREEGWLLASGGGAGTGPSRGKPVTSYPIRLVTSVRALVGVSQLWSSESLSRASASVLPMIGITPRQDRDLIRRAAILGHALLQIAVRTPCARQLLDDG